MDIIDVIPLNRTFSEVATDVLDIINYFCVNMETEALTRQGWKRRADLRVGDEILTLNPETDAIEWQQIESLSDFDYDGPLVRWDNRIDALTTPNHRWLVESRYGRKREFIREIARTSKATDGDKAVSELTQGSRIITGGGTPLEFATEAKWSDELVETVGWYLTEGADIFAPSGWHSATISQRLRTSLARFRQAASLCPLGAPLRTTQCAVECSDREQ